MSYNKKYYYDFVDLDNNTHTVEIHQWVPVPPIPMPVKVQAGEEPFTTFLSTVDSKLTPIRGSGAELQLLATFPLQYSDLYTAEDQEYQVLHYINSNLNWCGFLNAEVFTSPINRNKNYIVSITANDGLAVLDTLNYLDEDDEPFTGMISQWDIIKYIVSKINLPFKNLYVNLATTIDGVTITSYATPFHYTYINNANFYDEDEKPMSLREVLESVLQPYGAFIMQSNADLYITDLTSIANGSPFSTNRYDPSTFLYVASITFDPCRKDLDILSFAGTGQNLDVLSGYNREVVSYSPYKHTDFLNYEPEYNTVTELSDFDTSIYIATYGVPNYRWRESYFENSKTWEVFNNGRLCYLQGLDVNEKETDSYLKIINYGLSGKFIDNASTDPSTKLSFVYKKPLPALYVSDSSTDNFFIKLEVETYTRTLDNMGAPTERGVAFTNLITSLRIGNRKYVESLNSIWSPFEPSTYTYTFPDGSTYDIGLIYKAPEASTGWFDIDDASTKDLILIYKDDKVYELHNFASSTPSSELSNQYSPINDKWINLNRKKRIIYGVDVHYPTVPQPFWYAALIYKTEQPSPFLIPLEPNNGDSIVFEIYGYMTYEFDEEGFLTETVCPDLRIRNVKMTIVDKNGNTVDDSDVEYIGYMNKAFRDEGDQISLTQGTNFTNYPIERGGLYKSTLSGYEAIQSWTRNTVSDNIENLLLRTYVGNYETKTIQLTVESRIPAKNIGYLTYNSYFPNKKLMINGYRHNYQTRTSELTLQEVMPDSLTINKSF